MKSGPQKNLPGSDNKPQNDIMAMYIELEKKNDEVEFQKRELELANAQISEAMNALWGEMELAKKIQHILIPQKPQISGYELSTHMTSTDLVGGDYYDVVNSENGDWIVIGDVSGHGITAGLIMMMVQTAIQTILMDNSDISPLELLTIVNRSITSNINKLGESKFMTMTVLSTQPSGKFIFSGLHQDILIYRKGKKQVETIETNGMWLGIEKDISEMLQTDTLELGIDDILVLFTDGLTEALDSKGNMFGSDRVIEILKEFGDSSTESVKKQILAQITSFNKTDDVTFLVIKRVK